MKTTRSSLANKVNKRIALWAVFFLGAVLLVSCSSSGGDSNIIDYSSLEKLSTEVVLTIGESEGYIPDDIGEVEVTPGGTVLVGDNGHDTIEQFDRDGKHVATIARSGKGPGELSSIFNLHLLNGDTLIARHRSGRKDYFARIGGESFKHVNTTMQANHTMRSLKIVKPVTGNKFYAVKKNMAALYNDLKDPKPIIKEAFVVVNESEKVVADSVHALNSQGRFSIEMKGGGFIRTMYRFQHEDEVVPLEEGNYLVARPDSSAFFVYDEDHKLKRRIPVNIKERPLTGQDLGEEITRLPDKAVNIIKNANPDVKPPYRKVFASDNYFWLLTESSKAGKEMVVLDNKGAPVGKFMLSQHDQVSHVEDGRIYTINSNPKHGDQVQVYEVDLNVQN